MNLEECECVVTQYSCMDDATTNGRIMEAIVLSRASGLHEGLAANKPYQLDHQKMNFGDVGA